MKFLKWFLILVVIDWFLSKYIKPAFFYRSNLFNYNGLCLPPFGIFILQKEQENEVLKKHELAHWKQYERMGFFVYYLRYAFEYAFYGYDKMTMEVEARRASGERLECLENYTYCVRAGISNTVANSKFRY